VATGVTGERELIRHRVWEASDCVPGVCDVLAAVSDEEWRTVPDLWTLAAAHRSDLARHGTDEDEFVLVTARWSESAEGVA
jgi:hypothetical protein